MAAFLPRSARRARASRSTWPGASPTASSTPADFEKIRDQVIDALSSFTDPATGRKPVKAIYRREEIDLARRIQAGQIAGQLQEALEVRGCVDGLRLRSLAESLVAIREHQIEEFGRLEGIGRDRVLTLHKPLTREDLDDLLGRVERDGRFAATV